MGVFPTEEEEGRSGRGWLLMLCSGEALGGTLAGVLTTYRIFVVDVVEEGVEGVEGLREGGTCFFVIAAVEISLGWFGLDAGLSMPGMCLGCDSYHRVHLNQTSRLDIAQPQHSIQSAFYLPVTSTMCVSIQE